MIFKNLYNKLEQMTSKSGIVILFLLAHSVLFLMMIFTFPRINAKFETLAFDLKSFGYTSVEAIKMIEKLDQSTIDFYIFPQLFLLDLLYPLLLALFLSVLIIRLSGLVRISSYNDYSKLFLLPFLAMIIDYAENIMIYFMITLPMNKSAIFIKIGSICTQLKGLFTSLSWIVILVLWIIWLMDRWKNKKIAG